MHAYTATFRRRSPESYPEQQTVLGWCVIPYQLVPDTLWRRQRHGTWFVLESAHDEICRVVTFNAKLATKPHFDVVIDWQGWVALHGEKANVEDPLELTIRPACWYEILKVYFAHPDPAYRLSSWFALMSFIAGIAIGKYWH